MVLHRERIVWSPDLDKFLTFLSGAVLFLFCAFAVFCDSAYPSPPHKFKNIKKSSLEYHISTTTGLKKINMVFRDSDIYRPEKRKEDSGVTEMKLKHIKIKKKNS